MRLVSRHLHSSETAFYCMLQDGGQAQLLVGLFFKQTLPHTDHFRGSAVELHVGTSTTRHGHQEPAALTSSKCARIWSAQYLER